MDSRPGYDRKLLNILRTAASVFAEKGYSRASIRDISSATGVSLSGLYYYFGSKEELLYLIQEHCFATLLARLEEDLEGVADAEGRLRIFIRNHLHFFVANMEEMKVLSHEAEVLTGSFRSRILDQKRAYAGELAGILSELRESGDVMGSGAEESSLPPRGEGAALRATTFVLFGMMNWIYTWYDPERDLPVEELERTILHLFLHGFLSPPASDAEVRLPEASRMGRSSIWRHPLASRPSP